MPYTFRKQCLDGQFLSSLLGWTVPDQGLGTLQTKVWQHCNGGIAQEGQKGAQSMDLQQMTTANMAKIGRLICDSVITSCWSHSCRRRISTCQSSRTRHRTELRRRNCLPLCLQISQPAPDSHSATAVGATTCEQEVDQLLP